jgi:hypothetical protein
VSDLGQCWCGKDACGTFGEDLTPLCTLHKPKGTSAAPVPPRWCFQIAMGNPIHGPHGKRHFRVDDAAAMSWAAFQSRIPVATGKRRIRLFVARQRRRRLPMAADFLPGLMAALVKSQMILSDSPEHVAVSHVEFIEGPEAKLVVGIDEVQPITRPTEESK